jgi:hypothetical protein
MQRGVISSVSRQISSDTKCKLRNRNPPDDWRLHVVHLKEVVVCNIKRFSHSKRKEEIREFIKGNFVIGTAFALGLPISALDLISDGIRHFSQ